MQSLNSLRGGRPYALAVVAATAVIALPALAFAVKKLLRKRGEQVQYTSSEFVLSAGAICFQFEDGLPKKVLLVHYTAKNEWLLAKGRKDQGEDLAAAAIREVIEETGYRCHLHPVPRLPTRAPPSAAISGTVFQPDIVRIAENGTEPFAITIRPTAPGRVKLIFWYIGGVDITSSGQGDGAPILPGSHMESEGFGDVGLFDIAEALLKLAYEGDRHLVRTAVSVLSPHASEDVAS